VADAINGTVVPLDPLAEDAIGNAVVMAERIAEAMRREDREEWSDTDAG